MPSGLQANADVSSADSGRTLLEVKDLRVSFHQGGTDVRAVDGVAFSVAAGETLAVVGESGSGKSVTMLSVMGLCDPSSARTSGSVAYWKRDGRELALHTSSYRELEKIRGGEIAMIFQDATASLNPLITIGDQIAETVRIHQGVDGAIAWKTAVNLLEDVGIAAAESRARNYPHELSGGMRQRVMIAIALAGQPRILIADEPTTALDVTVQTQILNLLEQIQEDRGLSVILVTHDLGVVAEIADRVAVMYAGQIVETGLAENVLKQPRHPYTAALLACLPHLEDTSDNGRKDYRRAKPGIVPTIGETFTGCRFRGRCPIAQERCTTDVPLLETGPGWDSRCFFWKKAA